MTYNNYSPKVTVLMTVYNAGLYLAHSIKSVLRQTYKDFELLIIDDCSSDGSFQVASSFNDDRIKVHRNSSNMGQTKSLNVGLKLAAAPYVARIDADDMVFSRWLQEQVAFIEDHPELSVASTQAVIIDENHNLQKTLRSSVAQEEILLKSLIRSPINHVGSIMRRNIILENGGYDENFKIAADYDLWSRLIERGYKISSTKETLVAIRVHSQSVSILERGGRDRSELLQIMHKNIKTLANAQFDAHDAQLLWMLIYDVDSLADHDFREAKEVIENIYGNLKTSLPISLSYRTRALQRQMQVIYAKRVFALIKKNDVLRARLLMYDYFDTYGWANIFLLFLILTFTGKSMIALLPRLYDGIVRLNTRLKFEKKLLTIFA
ncbi:MAG TPA: glycosyltransferase [Candidatus Omnitrophota bacterium]|nr:glycosyltransferase [Candidatus Omnitrophota bacterium]HPD84088.1 glycosyltransferase [Candidatus Omnitrophota bacterium]HRZ02945.1 glycosyltransferase [Candidatus Omnitrophota bacterium]